MSIAWCEWEPAHRRVLTTETTGRVGAMLWAENARSVNHRYVEEQWEPPYAYDAIPHAPGSVDPLDVLEAVARYEYQSREHPGWAISEARLFCAALTKRAVETLLDHRDAPRDVNDRELWSS
jgi:hypothetical protein